MQQGGEVIHQGTKEAGGGGPKQADSNELEVDLSAERQNLTEESAYSMEPVECLSRAVVMVMHSHSHLSEKKVWVTFDIFTDPRLQEGPPSVWGCGFSGGGQGHKGVGHNRGQGDGSD